ncbi:MAG: YafY family transcriptional regulator [Lachnospiraceae bacterium]|nr:YafY family transcriptional regulator [Lachnospiraceae bacterium]
MKVDRILEIIIYLLNHDNVPASFLAERFHVSVRTIQRDMISISSIGIPVYSEGGKKGGYSILPTYKMRNTDIREDEQQMIIKALESLATSYKSDTLDSLIEKYNAIIEKEGGRKVFWDFSVTKENRQVQDMNKVLEQAISNRNYVAFDYRNANGDRSHPVMEPLAIHYKWYAWYLFAYDSEKKEYRTFKVARMQNLVTTPGKADFDHGDIEERMKESEQAYYKTCINIEVHFDKEESGLIEEYFPDCTIEHLDENLCRIFIDVPSKERLWKALLLSFGDRVKVIGPDSYRDELINTAQKFLSNYDIQLSQ